MDTPAVSPPPKSHAHSRHDDETENQSNGRGRDFQFPTNPIAALFEAGRKWGFPALAFFLAAAAWYWQASTSREDLRSVMQAEAASRTAMIEQLTKAANALERTERGIEGVRSDVQALKAEQVSGNTKLDAIQRSLERHMIREHDRDR